jgi:hypothetical protein
MVAIPNCYVSTVCDQKYHDLFVASNRSQMQRCFAEG